MRNDPNVALSDSEERSGSSDDPSLGRFMFAFFIELDYAL